MGGDDVTWRRVLDVCVCDDCYDQIHGLPTTPRHRPRNLVLFAAPRDDDRSITSSSTTTITPALSRKSRTVPASPIPSHIIFARLALAERSYGELDAYPLRIPSILCKATGSSRWEPKQQTILSAYRPPGGKAPFEIELEHEEQETKISRPNPVIKDGDFQYCFPLQIIQEHEFQASKGFEKYL